MCRAKKSREAYDMLTAATEQIEARAGKSQKQAFPIPSPRTGCSDASAHL
jgi:hypothetical protein